MNIDHAKFNIHNSMTSIVNIFFLTKYLGIWDTNARQHVT
jgi:hypothetical protein